MARVVAGMTTSLDGFVADRNGGMDGLYPDLEALHDTDYLQDTIARTGAVLMGRDTFAMGDPDWYVGNYEFQVPIFVVTHAPPDVLPKQDERLTFTFVTDGVESAVARARDAAGDMDVQVVGGPVLIGQLLRAGLVDELCVDVMPVLMGSGLRYLDGEGLERVRLEKVDVREAGARTGLRFRVVH